MKKSTAQKNKGFTLLETLVAIAILGVAVGSAMSISQKSLSSAYYSQDQTTAFFLASEGVELIRNRRDNVVLENRAIDQANDAGLAADPGYEIRDHANWLNGIIDKCQGSSGCRVDAQTTDLEACPSSGCDFLYLSSAGIFNHDTSGTKSKFTRKIMVTERVQDKEADVTVTVTWRTGSFNQNTFTVTETLFDTH